VNELRVCMDPMNPGQFFACCGLFELVGLYDPDALAHFALDSSRPRAAEFVCSTADNLKQILGALKSADVDYPDKEVDPPTRPSILRYRNHDLELDWWLDEFRQETTSFKCWAGQVTTAKLFSELLPLLDEESTGDDIFERARMTKSKFGVDPRSAWNALDFGFSPNEHGRDAATFPAVDILAAIGLQGFRPENRRTVTYHLWHVPLPPAVARVAFHSPWRGLPASAFRFSIDKRGQSYKYFAFAAPFNKENNANERKSIRHVAGV